MNLKLLIKSSRPRFWAYVFGPYLVGFFAALDSPDTTVFSDYRFWLFLLFFLFPANLFIYGINDLSDKDTDKFNKKKGKQEILLEEKNTKLLTVAVILSGLVGLTLAIFEETRWILLSFMLLGAFYSVAPIRFKARPFLDSLSNVFYVFPAFISYSFNADLNFSLLSLLAILVWPISMHLYSAIPDIEADTKANLKTTAIVLGRKSSLLLCLSLWLIFSLVPLYYGYLLPFSFILLIYPTLPLLNLINPKAFPEDKTYWYFPYINFLVGFGYSMLLIYSLWTN